MAEKRTTLILIGMVVGILVGLVLNRLQEPMPWLNVVLTDGLFEIIGQVFLSLLMVMVIPIVFVSLVCGVAALEDIRRVGRIGGKAVLLYLGTTTLAITFALTAAIMARVGEGFGLGEDVDYQPPEVPSLIEVIIGLVPRNIFAAMAAGQVLPIIVFAILFGISAAVAGDTGRRLLDVFDAINAVLMKMVGLILWLAPLGVLALIARVFAHQGLDAFILLFWYMLVVAGLLLVQGFVVYPTLLVAFSRLNPLIFMRKMRTAQVFAFGTSSSAATIPVTLEAVRGRMGVNNSVASFTVPLGATINMDGTAIMQGVATVFIANAYGAELGLPQYLMVVLTATLASIGTAGVPGAGLIMLSIVLVQVQLPVEGIALVLGVDRILDMIRTAVNITGDATVSCIVAKSEGALDPEIYNTPWDEPSKAATTKTVAEPASFESPSESIVDAEEP